MPRKNMMAEVNSFIGGLVTEANPLAFPDNASIDEENFELNNNGVRRRRLGFTHEPSYTVVNTGSQAIGFGPCATTSFLWKSPGGNADKQLLVVQMGHKLQFFDTSVSPLSSGLIYTMSATVGKYATSPASYASIGNNLVVVDGFNDPKVFTYDGTNITYKSIEVKIRDLSGLQDSYGSYSDMDGSDTASIRPTNSGTSLEHYYNLRNQGWGIPRALNANWISDDEAYDPITAFKIDTGLGSISASSLTPSNGDTVVANLAPDANAHTSKVLARFYPKQCVKNPPGSTVAPRGHYIISATNRGTSRWSEFHKSETIYPELDVISTTGYVIKEDAYYPASVVSSFSGRVFYAGLAKRFTTGTGASLDYDSRSPQINTHIYYSQLVNRDDDIAKCYQEGDPTSSDSPDIIDTDGGFINIKEMDRALSMINIGKALIVVATNGVWSIAGGNNYSFSATNFVVTKITEHGCVSAKSVVLVDGSVMYWGDDGIYHISFDQYGDLKAQNISNTKINKFYNSISTSNKTTANGMYDTYERRVRWLYQNDSSGTNFTYELILDMTIGAFTKHRIGNYYLHKVVGIVEVPPYKLPSKDAYQRNMYIIDNNSSQSGIIDKPYTFGYYHDETFYDYYTVDTPAYLQTGYSNSGTNLLNKQVPFLNVFMERTEDGFTASGGDFVPTHQSSCLVRTMWDWSDSIKSGMWGVPFQAYRYKRQYWASSVSDTYDYGQNIIETKNRLRGKGKVLSIYYTTEPGKDCRICGWSTMVSADGRV